MTQLILDTGGATFALPESRKGGYSIQEMPLTNDVEMISGRIAREYRGKVWKISHQYGYFNDADMQKFISICRKGTSGSILCSFIVPGSTEMQTSRFIVTDWKQPKFMWSREGKPLWGDYYIELREVKPHD